VGARRVLAHRRRRHGCQRGYDGVGLGTVGGGVEWVFGRNWSAFAEYNYLDFGTPGVTFTSAAGGTTFPINIRQNINSFMVGVNYRFGAY
jgi:opacity protein-like surface antigen